MRKVLRVRTKPKATSVGNACGAVILVVGYDMSGTVSWPLAVLAVAVAVLVDVLAPWKYLEKVIEIQDEI